MLYSVWLFKKPLRKAELLHCIAHIPCMHTVLRYCTRLPLPKKTLKRYVSEPVVSKILQLLIAATYDISSSIQTVLSVLESHQIMCSRTRGLYRRSGISPCPEDFLLSSSIMLVLIRKFVNISFKIPQVFLRAVLYPVRICHREICVLSPHPAGMCCSC